jgi:hypothetical protein
LSSPTRMTYRPQSKWPPRAAWLAAGLALVAAAGLSSCVSRATEREVSSKPSWGPPAPASAEAAPATDAGVEASRPSHDSGAAATTLGFNVQGWV